MHSKESMITGILGDNREEEGFKSVPKEGQREGFCDGLKGGSLKVTVETETVQVPAGGLAPRQRKGMETMKGTRAKKKRSRLTNVPSKSEVFAAKIASAIDENIDSDSDETFVYETNARSPRQLSRTSSISSIVSHSRHDGRIGLSGKHSMKFTNHSWSSDPDHKDSFIMFSDSTRSPGRTSMFPSCILSKIETGLRSPHRIGSRTTSCPSSPHYKHQKLKHYNTSCRRHFIDKNASQFCAAHDEFYPYERIPLLYKDIGYFSEDRYHECRQHNKRKRYIFFRKFKWFFVFFLIFLVCTIILMVITQPLQEPKIANATNIVVSPQVIIMDLEMVAFNPNFWQISIQKTNIAVFSSKPWSDLNPINNIDDSSKGSSKLLRPRLKMTKRNINQTDLFRLTILNDTVNYQDRLILLGHVFQLDVPFVFRSAFFSKSISRSIAQFRLENSNHSTLQDDFLIRDYNIDNNFQLVIKGFFSYYSSLFSRKQQLIQIDHLINLYP
ncbi:hypothetical protein PMAC_003041 [Pneumocystis sp. 'macacae']|nr:hypothetical protein PMAC_003041 [Pneumocystis sp. 'macacae']